MMKKLSDLNVEKVCCITVAKVASSAFIPTIKQAHKDKYETHHRHSLKYLEDIMESDTSTLIIAGVRNPLSRNISYFFQTYDDKNRNDLQCPSNNFKGEKTFLMPAKKILDFEADELINMFFSQTWHYTFNEWFREFFRITQIDSVPFDKEVGYKLYPVKNNHWVLIYTFEQLPKNINSLSEFLESDTLFHTNNAKDRVYGKIYKKVCKQIEFSKEYKKALLDTEIMHYFYTEDKIKSMGL
jgi:hypothetical protein